MADSHDHEFYFSTTIDDDHTESTTNDLEIAFGITLFAGLAVFIGALPILCLRNKITDSKFMKLIIPITLGFSAGVTIYLSFVNLLSHSIAYSFPTTLFTIYFNIHKSTYVHP